MFHSFNICRVCLACLQNQIKTDQIKSFILSLEQQSYTIVFSVGTNTLLQINYTERGFQKSRVYRAGLVHQETVPYVYL